MTTNLLIFRFTSEVQFDANLKASSLMADSIWKLNNKADVIGRNKNLSYFLQPLTS